MSQFWSIFIIVLSLLSIAGCWWLISVTSKKQPGEDSEAETTGHTWDVDLEELNNPLPRWWLGLFVGTMIFALVYFALYPGLGNFSGLMNWSSVSAYEQEMQAAEEKYGEVFKSYAAQSIPDLATDLAAVKVGRRLFLNNCSTCHGSDAKGVKGYPNLTDNDWLYGGQPDEIKLTITQGRSGIMPPLGAALGPGGVENMIEYLRSLHEGNALDEAHQASHQQFQTLCSVCHGADATGNPLMGAPNLTDNTWLYGGTDADITATLMQGRTGQMPGFKARLSEEKIHLLAAYVYSLSRTSD